MTMAVEAPAAPPASPPSTMVQGVDIVDSGPPAPPPKPTSEIHVTPATVSQHDPMSSEPRKGSAMEKMRDELRKRAKPKFYEPAEEAVPPPQAQPPSEGQHSSPPGEKEGAEATKQAPPPPSAPEDKSKKNPWKLVDDYKARASKAEQRIAELEKALPEITKVQEFQKLMESERQRNEELEKEIRFANYAKSKEYQDQYEKPYTATWARYAKEISQITATDKNGETRPGSVEDIAEIANLPLGEAQLLAEEKFGSLAHYVMGYRAKILELHEKKATALEEARNASIQRDEQNHQQKSVEDSQREKSIREVWDKANQDILADETHGPLFRESEGDDDGNARLAKGMEMANLAFSQSPNDPKLTPEQRAEIVKRHAAVRLRAAAFGRCNAQRLQAMARIAELEKQLDGFKASEPATGGSVPAPSDASGMKGFDRIRAELMKIAK